MTRMWGSHPAQQVGAVYVLIMLLIAAGGVRADRMPRILLLGKPDNLQWNEACGCSTGQFRTLLAGDVYLTSQGGDLLTRDGYLIVSGHLFPTNVVVDYVIELGAIDSDPKQLVGWLRSHRPLAAIVLFALATFGWYSVSFLAAFLSTVMASAVSAIALSVLALSFRIGLPDPAWSLTLVAAGCVGWLTARHLDSVLEGKAQAIVMSLATALLFRDVAGVIGGIAGVALPALSRRVALGFLVAVAVVIVVDLADVVLQFAAGSSLAVAAIDRWRAPMRATPATA